MLVVCAKQRRTEKVKKNLQKVLATHSALCFNSGVGNNTGTQRNTSHKRKDKIMKIATCCHCHTTHDLHRLFSPSRYYFSICPACAGLNTGLAEVRDADETLEVHAVFPTDADAQNAHDAIMGQFPSDAAIRVESIRVENGNNAVFTLLVPTDRRCDAAKALDTFQREWNTTITAIEGTRFEFPVDCKTTDELRKRQKFCRDNRDKAKYPALRNDR